MADLHQSGHPFSHVISLGLGCPTAHFIREAGLRCYAGPFDWTLATPQVIEHCIDDNFSDYLNTKFYEETDTPGCWKNTKFEELYGLPKLFGHHDLRQPSAWRHVEWGAERFLALLENHDRKMLVIMHTELTHPAFESLFKKISTRTKNSKILGMQINFPQNQFADRSVTRIKQSETCDIYDFHSSSHWPHGLGFENEDDNQLMLNIFRRYHYDLKRFP